MYIFACCCQTASKQGGLKNDARRLPLLKSTKYEKHARAHCAAK